MSVDPDRETDAERALRRWSEAHGGVDPHASPWIRGWLVLVHRLASPLAARHVPPASITVSGLLASSLVPLVAGAPGGWPLAAGLLAVTAGLLDGMDGAVARLDGTDSAWGAVLDEVADRVSDLLLLSALWVLGAPAWTCLLAAALTVLLESVRSSARARGMPGVGAITVWERPSRVILVTTVAALCGLAQAVDPALDLPAESVDVLATVGAAVAAVLAAWSVVHLGAAARRDLRTVRRAD